MGAIKIKSDEVIINNESELITPAIVRQVNDVIDAEVENAKTRLSTLETNLSTTNTTVTTLSETVANLGNSANSGIPNGGTTGQVLAKKTNADKDTNWIDATNGGSGGIPNGGTTGQVLAKKTNADKDTNWISPPSVLPSGGTTGQVLTKTSTGQVWAATLEPNLSGYATTEYVLQVAAQKLSIFGGTVNGSVTVNGNVIVTSAITTSNPIEANGGINSPVIYKNQTSIDLQNRMFRNQSDLPFEYAGDYSENYTERSIVDKSYVDLVATTTVRIAKKVLFGFPPQNSVITIDHNFNDDNVMVEIWVAFQDGGSMTQQGYKKLELDRTKINIVKTGSNQIKIDVLGKYSIDQTLGTVEIYVYSYPNTIVTEIE